MKSNRITSAGHSSNTIVSRSQFKPILFSTAMVAAIINGDKTQTRRKVPEKIVDAYYDYDDWASSVMPTDIPCSRTYDKEYFMERCRWNIGDIIWVRETWRIVHINHNLKSGDFFTIQFKDYWALEFNRVKDFQEELRNKFYEKAYEISGIGDAYGNWRPSMFMPKYACRLFLEITNIRTERIKDINEDDAHAEGIVMTNTPHEGWYWMEDVYSCTCPIFAYHKLWEKINGQESLVNNDWVYVITFKIAECPKGFC